MSLTIKGRLANILKMESGQSKAGKEWKKQSFVIDTGDQYNPNVCFSLFGDDKIALLSQVAVGQDIEVSFNVSSREYQGKWFHNLDAWKITGQGGQAPSNGSVPPPSEEDFMAEGGDDLPF
jgi:hypothetical protein